MVKLQLASAVVLLRLLLLFPLPWRSLALDSCNNDNLFFQSFHWSVMCAAVRADLAGGLNCDSVGALCPVSCGLCEKIEARVHCDASEIYQNQVHLVNTLQKLGVCSDCVANPSASAADFVYVEKPPGLIVGVTMGGYSTLDPRDPCLAEGVTCDRCGAAHDLAFGFPTPVFLPGAISLDFFRLTRLSAILMYNAADVGMLEHAEWIPASAWRSLQNLTFAVMDGVLRGEVPLLSHHTSLSMVRLVKGALVGDLNNLLGSPLLRLMASEADTFNLANQSGTVELDMRVCNSPLLQNFHVPSHFLHGSLPTCMGTLTNLVDVGIFDQPELGGRIELLLQSNSLASLNVGGCNLSGSIPDAISEYELLTRLSLQNNRLEGELPDLSRASSLAILELQGNRLTGASGSLTGSRLEVNLAGNLFRAFPAEWNRLPGVRSLDLSNNALESWPAAGVYTRGLLTPEGLLTSCTSAVAPFSASFDWPDMQRVSLAHNPLHGVDVRNVLGSMSYLPGMQVVDVRDCGLAGDLPLEGYLLPTVDISSCTSYITPGFGSLVTLRASGNAIEAVGGGPWAVLQNADFSYNNLTYVHPSWFTASVTVQNYRGNPALRLDIQEPPASGICSSTEEDALIADPRGFSALRSPDPSSSECTSLCGASSIVAVDGSANATAMCRCKAGWYGSGTSCHITEADYWSPTGAAEPTSCPANSSTQQLQGQTSEDACKCNPGLFASYAARKLICTPCPANTIRTLPGAVSLAECELCEAGRTSSAGGQRCTPCPLGSVAAGSDGDGCRQCGEGSFSAIQGETGCSSCPFGQYQNSSGASACIACSGEATTTWALQKAALPSGGEAYQQMQGAPSAEHCGCQSGYLEVQGRCELCDVEEREGLECPGGLSNDVVLLRRGYYSGPEISMYRCWGDEARCPGGRQPGLACATGRIGLLCALCEDGKAPASGGKCETCTGSGQATFPAVLLLALAATVVLYFVMDLQCRSAVMTAGFAVFVTSVMSIFVSVTQQVGVIAQLADTWFQPLSSFIDLLGILTFGVEILQINCVTAVDPLDVFLMKLFTIFFSMFLVVLVHVVVVIVWRKARFSRHNPTLISALGTVTTAFYIAVVITITGPFQCQSHPNGRWTARSYQSIECWTSKVHTTMMIWSSCSMLIPVAYLAGVCWVVRQYPFRVNRADANFLKSFRFLLLRFKAKAYWYAAVVTAKGFCLALIAATPNTYFGSFLVSLVLSASFFVTATTLPWRVGLANALDVVLTVALIILLSLGVHEEAAQRDSQRMLSWAYVVGLSTVLAAMPIVVIVRFVLDRCYPMKKYQYFLCHYKAQAGAFARLLKTMFLDHEKRPRNAFLDSDNLDNLEDLFTYVRKDTEVLLALNSSGLLWRPWCAGEIITAHAADVPVLPIRMQDFVDNIGPAGIEEYHSTVDISCLTEAGISVSMLRTSLLWFSTLPAVQLTGASLSKTLVSELVTTVLHIDIGKMKDTVTAGTAKHVIKVTATGIVVDHQHPDVVSAALVLEKYLTSNLLADSSMERYRPWTVDLGMTMMPDDAAIAICMFSVGCMSSRGYMMILGNVAERDMVSVPVIVQESFRVPSREELLKNEDVRDVVVDYIMGMFKTIAKLFDAQHASDTVLQVVSRSISDLLFNRIRHLSAHETDQIVRTGTGNVSHDSKCYDDSTSSFSSPTPKTEITLNNNKNEEWLLPDHVPSERELLAAVAADPDWGPTILLDV